MRERIDLDNGDSRKDLEEALHQLQRPSRRSPEDPAYGGQVQDALRELAEQQRAEKEAKGARVRARPSRLPWWVIAVLVAAGVVVAVLLVRPEPLPPPATSAQEAVTSFWQSLIDGKYEAATAYCPSMVDKYGNRKQAAQRLREHFRNNPPVQVSKVGSPEQLPDSPNVSVRYEVYLRSGAVRTGDAIVSNSEGAGGYVIVAGI